MKFIPSLKLPRIDRLVLATVFAYGLLGSVLMIMVQSPGRSEIAQASMLIAGTALIVCVLAALWYGSKHGSASLGQNGFSLGWGMWLNLGLLLASTTLVLGQLELIKRPTTVWAFWMTLGAFTEEIVFRVYLIRTLSFLISPRKAHVTWAVFLSAVLFTAMHLFRQTTPQLFGLFLTSVIAGYITYYTRSVLLAAYAHVVSNTAQEMGLLGGAAAVTVYFVIALWSSFRRNPSRILVDSKRP